MSNPTFAIIGTGAIGGYYGACLQRAGNEVHYLLNRDYEIVKKSGLVIESIKGNFTLPQVKVYQNAVNLPACDVVIIALKTTKNNLLPHILPYVLKQEGIIIVLQNGLGIEEEIEKIAFDLRASIFGGLCFICSNKIAPGHICHLDYGKISLAQYLPQYKRAGITDSMSFLANIFENADIQVELKEDLLFSRWQKLVWNIPYNGLSVVLDATTEHLMANIEVRSLIEAIMLEVKLAALGCSIQIEDSFIQQMLEATLKMKPYRTSMKIDYDEGRPLEIEAIFAKPLKMASLARTDLPKIRMLYQQLKFLDRRNTFF